MSAANLMRGRLNTSVGLVGLPNVGKSTLFNYLCGENKSFVANYPFATIEPCQALVSVPDQRLEQLARAFNSKRIIRDYVQVHDIAGLVKGASQGAGLGNAFLSHIRAVDAIVHVCRVFEDTDVIHVSEGKRDPIKDVEVVELELILADLDSVEKRLMSLIRKQGMEAEKKSLQDIKEILLRGEKPKLEEFSVPLAHMNLLSLKPVLYALITDNVGGNDEETKRIQTSLGGPQFCIPISSKLESELNLESDVETRNELMKEFGLDKAENSSLYRLSQAISHLLKRRVFYTVGPEEARSWAMAENETAVIAASRIHSDIAKGFVNCDIQRDVKDTPKVEGKDYKMKDGDIVYFRHRG